MNRPIGLGLLAALALVVPASRMVAESTSRTRVEEKVEVRLTQIELTVWPKSGDAAACRDLSASDIRLEVNGKPREVVALDPAKAVAPETRGQPDPPADALTLVVYFDLWHLDLFSECCGPTKHLAFEQARRMVREAMHPGDRLLLVTFAGWPVVNDGWLRDQREALTALDRLEVSPLLASARFDHSHHQVWVSGMESLMLALGRYPGRKEVLYLGDDIEIGDVRLRMREIGARAQANRVVMHAVDLVWACRPQLCSAECGSCRFRTPVALGPLSWTTGGRLFGTGEMAEAVARIRDRNCRYVLSFRTTPDDSRSPPKIAVAILRDGLELAAPESFEDPSRGPTDREARDALFLLPQFGRGASVEAKLWPLHPSGKRDRWKAALVARIRAVPEELEALDVETLEVRGVVHSASKVFGQFVSKVSASELRELARTGRGKLMNFPVEVRPGPVTIAINVRDGAGDVEANFRATATVPRPPGEGEARPWLLADGVAREGDDLRLTPSLDGVLSIGAPKLVVGWGCPGSSRGLRGVVGFLAGSEDEQRVTVPVRRLDGGTLGCGWLVATIPYDLPAGLWRFEPPPALGGGEPVAFRVEGR